MNIMVHVILINKIVRKTVAMFLLKIFQYRTQKKHPNIQSTLFLHQCEVVPYSYFTFFNFETNIRINIFITI